MPRTLLLFAALAIVVVAVGSRFGVAGVVVAVVLVVLVDLATYALSDKVALKVMRAYPVTEATHPRLHRIVRELCSAARQPVPALYVAPTTSPNAFAVGRSPRTAAICCTDGLLDLLDERELRAVVAHELAHVRGRELLGSSLVTTFASEVLLLAQVLWLLPIAPDDPADLAADVPERRPGPVRRLALAVLAPISAALVQAGVSHTREYRADADGAEICGDPEGLARALGMVDAGTRARPLRPEPELQPTSALMFTCPFRSTGISRLFGTHPPVAERIARLRES